jgi:ubiquinone/menaquinone biosynthesis C-methylase UbiE
VLDVGCGQGIDVYCFAAAGASVTGIDLTPRHIELARRHLAAMNTDAQIVEGDAEALPFPDAAFDRVSSNGVLHHTPDIQAALSEIRRVLKPAGQATIVVYNRNSLHYWLYQFAERGLLRGGLVKERSMSRVLSSSVEYSSIGARPLVRVYTAKHVRRLLAQAGFEAVTTGVRHFRAVDTRITSVLARWVQPLENPRLLDRIGCIAGWYIIARARRTA